MIESGIIKQDIVNQILPFLCQIKSADTSMCFEVEQVSVILWDKDTQCIHRLAILRARVKSLATFRSRALAPRAMIPKEHSVYLYAVDCVQRFGSASRRCEEHVEHSIQHLKKQLKMTRSIVRGDQKAAATLKRASLEGNPRKKRPIPLGRKCPTCGLWMNKKAARHCNCNT